MPSQTALATSSGSKKHWKLDISLSLSFKSDTASRISWQLILVAVSDLKLSDEEMSSVHCLLDLLLMVRAVWEGTATYKEEVHKTIGTKLHMAEYQCLDAVPRATILEILANCTR